MTNNFLGVIIEESLEDKKVLKITKYVFNLGIPDYQLDFSPHIKVGERIWM